MKPKDTVLGIDFGQTIESHDENHVKIENPRAMEVIARCVKHCKNVYIVSKVNEEQKRRLLMWCAAHDFYNKTGITKDKIFFCTRRRDKGEIVKQLGINYFIDDRPEVMLYMPRNVYKILFRPIELDVKIWRQEHVKTVESWTEIERIIFEGIV